MNLSNTVNETIIKERLIENGDNVVVALSGGPDSVFLFTILCKLKKTFKFRLYAAHVNHMYRGEDAYRDEVFVQNLCIANGVKLYIKRKNAMEYATELGMTGEEAGRKLRYDFFEEISEKLGKTKIAVAHNLDDQAETVLQRVIRGSGIDGLAAMDFKKGNIIRPILNITRKEIVEYLNADKIEYCVDYTNDLPIYGRNKIRLNLLPELENTYNHNIKNGLFRLSQNMRDDKQIIEKYIDKIYLKVLEKKNAKELSLNLKKTIEYEDYEIFRLLRKSISEFKGSNVNIERKHLENAITLIRAEKTGKVINISDGINISINYNYINISNAIEKTEDFYYNVDIFDELAIEYQDKKIKFDVIYDFDDEIVFDDNVKEYYFDLDTIDGNLIMRNRKNGDAMIPYGMEKSKKLKDVFIDNKVPVKKRNSKMILTDENKIIWLEDFRISNLCKITKATKKVLKLTILED